MGEKKKNILVHICCVSCFSYVFKTLEKEGFEVSGFFYNPSVHGRAEYETRLSEVQKFCKKNEIKLTVPKYDIQEFLGPIMPYQDKNSIKFINDKKRWRTKRCQMCYHIILNKTLSEAKNNKIGSFTTTMLATPYKDHDEIWNIGLELEREYKINFYYQDFRKGYWSGRNYARSHGHTVPRYCGCGYSLEEGILE